MGNFGPNSTMNADPAGVIWMYSDENGANYTPEVGPTDIIIPNFAAPDRSDDMAYSTCAIAKGSGPDGGLTMAEEIFNGHRVDIFWPGTGECDLRSDLIRAVLE
jgi:hypothetical protein